MKSWSEILKIVQEGNAKEHFSLGDTFPVSMSDGTKLTFEIAAINLSGNNLIFVMKDCMSFEKCLNGERIYSEKEGWKNCDMRKYLNEDIFSMLPEDLQNVISPRTLIQSIYGKRYMVEDKIWIPSQSEMFESIPDVADAGDEHFPLYKTIESRIKNKDGKPSWYWLRTPYCAYAYTARRVSPEGELYNYYANYESGISFAFMIA